MSPAHVVPSHLYLTTKDDPLQIKALPELTNEDGQSLQSLARAKTCLDNI